MVPVYGREQISQKGGGFGLAHNQVTAVAQGVSEQLKRPALQFGGEVDQNVAAHHQVDVRERRTLGQVVLPEHDHAPNLLLYLVGAVLLDQVVPYLLFGEPFERRGRVDAAPGEYYGILVYVRGEDPDVEEASLPAKHLGDQDRQGIGLLAGGAPGRPDPELVLPFAGLLDEPGQHLLFEVVEQLRVAEEFGHLDEEGAYKLLVLLRMLLHIRGVLVEALAAGSGHPATQAPQDRGPLVAPEVHAAVAVQFLEETLQIAPFIRALLRHRYTRDQFLQYGPDLLQGRDDVNGARGQRAWHLTELGGRGVLDDDRAPCLADGACALGAIRA